jgi:hypothetical protein
MGMIYGILSKCDYIDSDASAFITTLGALAHDSFPPAGESHTYTSITVWEDTSIEHTDHALIRDKLT